MGADKINFLSVRHGVKTVTHFVWIIAFQSFVKVGVTKINAFDFLSGHVSQSIGDFEPPSAIAIRVR